MRKVFIEISLHGFSFQAFVRKSEYCELRDSRIQLVQYVYTYRTDYSTKGVLIARTSETMLPVVHHQDLWVYALTTHVQDINGSDTCRVAVAWFGRTRIKHMYVSHIAFLNLCLSLNM